MSSIIKKHIVFEGLIFCCLYLCILIKRELFSNSTVSRTLFPTLVRLDLHLRFYLLNLSLITHTLTTV